MEENLQKRHALISESVNRLKSFSPCSDLLVLAATDVFVEKAQSVLSRRARDLVGWGKLCAILAALVMVVGIGYLVAIELGYLGKCPSDGYDSFTFTLKLVRMTTLSGFILGLVFFLMWLAKSLLHEGMVLYNRRHAMRFGRLFVYTKHGRVTLPELVEAFQWNTDYGSAFRDMKPESFFRTILHKVVEMPPDALRALGSIFSKKSATSEKEDLK